MTNKIKEKVVFGLTHKEALKAVNYAGIIFVIVMVGFELIKIF